MSTTGQHFLVIDDSDRGAQVIGPFNSTDAARDWEDQHEHELDGTVIGCAERVPAHKYLRDARLANNTTERD